MVGYALLLVPLVVWFLSISVKPVFFERYLMPSLLGVAIILARVISYFDDLATTWLAKLSGRSPLARTVCSRPGSCDLYPSSCSWRCQSRRPGPRESLWPATSPTSTAAMEESRSSISSLPVSFRNDTTCQRRSETRIRLAV
jgi:hypothetical protein